MEIEKIPLFRDFSKDELAAVKKNVHEKSFAKGEIIHHEGQTCERVFIVQEGKVKLCRTSSGGREQVLEMLGSCETCACNPGAPNWTCPMTAQAATPCKVLFLSRDDYSRLVEQNSNFSHSLTQLLAERVVRFSRLVEDMSLSDVRKRLAKFLLDMLAKNGKAKDVLFIPFTRQDIAERLGAARETIARHISDFRKKKLIDVRPYQIIIRDRAALEKIAE